MILSLVLTRFPFHYLLMSEIITHIPDLETLSFLILSTHPVVRSFSDLSYNYIDSF
jgi:hypothetical protein